MTNTEAFKKAMEIIDSQEPWIFEPVKAFITPIRVIHMYARIGDYFAENKKFPTSYKNLHEWEKKYYEYNL